MKILKWIGNNILFLITLFLLIFIPLYPKIPLLDVHHTWVYVRVEDFIIVFVLLLWLALLYRKKITLKTPLTMPILLFWLAGGIATIHGILLIFPDTANVFPNVAFLSFLRRIEYMSLFFVAFAALKDKRMLPYVIAVLTLTLLSVVAYGVGQKYLGFPAFLTMNEEFAKGTPIQLSALSRVPSTFAGHYDLAAYLVLILPILTSLIFGFRNWFVKFFLAASVASGIALLFMTVSRVSFVVLLISLAAVFYLHKKKLFFIALPVLGIFLLVLFMQFSPRLLDRFGSTVKEIDILVDARNGQPIGQIKEINPQDYKDKVVKQRFYTTPQDVNAKSLERDDADKDATGSAAAIVPLFKLPSRGVLLVQPNAPNGETLPQGTGYTNLLLSPVKTDYSEFFTERPKKPSPLSADVFMFSGRYLVKTVDAYDLSFTTRYQGEWPHAIEAFKRNIFLGSGYGSISLAIDNSYLRMLGEVGGFGFAAFLTIFLVIGIYIKRILPHVDSPVVRSFVLGFGVGVVGLALNATLIDVFEASKVAFYLWMLTGITLGILHLYQTKPIPLFTEFKKLAGSSLAIIVYLGMLITFLYSSMISNYFIGDDFTWLRWAADCGSGLTSTCAPTLERVTRYFTDASGFFYRPGTKTYFLLMYSAFGLNQAAYHIVSILLHFIVTALIFLVARKVLKDTRLSVFAAFVFVMLSSYSEATFWIASIGHLVYAMFALLSLYLFILWDEKKKISYFLISLLCIAAGLLFQEAAAITPLLIIAYKLTIGGGNVKSLAAKKAYYALLFAPVFLYLVVRFFAHSHWSGGDYNYDLLMLPFNIFGNAVGYIMLSLLGPMAMSIYEPLRNISKTHIIFAIPAMIAIIAGIFIFYSKIKKVLSHDEKRIIVFGLLFMVIVVMPFLGLGNITSRYTYLVSFGFVLLFAIFVKKLYTFLLSNGRDIAMAGTSLFVGIFLLLQIIQSQQIKGDWYEAGLRVNKVMVGVQSAYSSYWSSDSVDLHLVNVPVRTGEAWVFPVGLEDALWFVLRNPKIHVYRHESEDEVASITTETPFKKVLFFDEQGQAIEKVKKREVQ